jgi:ribokinase
LQPEHLENADKFFSTADLVLVQLEIPMNVVEAVYENAKNTELNLGFMPLRLIKFLRK